MAVRVMRPRIRRLGLKREHCRSFSLFEDTMDKLRNHVSKKKKNRKIRGRHLLFTLKIGVK